MLAHRCDRFYPRVYACEYVASQAQEAGVKMHWPEAGKIIAAVAQALGVPEDDLARKMADFYLAAKVE